MNKPRAPRMFLAIVSCLALIVGVFGLAVVPIGGNGASAANLQEFRAGNIIDDVVFFDARSMDAQQIQQFLNERGGVCALAYTCLKDYRITTPSKPADAMCGAYTGAQNETAARMIEKVALACGISPKVILVMLEKEQSLVTHRSPSNARYQAAMGMACPDTAPCSTEYYGLFNQVYGGARQFKRYANPPGTSQFFTWYRPGRVANVQYNPNAGCGSSPVLIENQATANLYYYTPYQPNAAAIRANYGRGDDCSAYGNRNFFHFFVDWFGSTRALGLSGPIKARYDQVGGVNGYLGHPLSSQQCGLTRGGCYQVFEGGLVYINPASGFAFDIADRMRPGWGSAGEWGWLGYPRSGTECGLAKGGCYQLFDGGTVFWSAATGAHAMSPAIAAKYGSLNAEWGTLGFPTAGVDCGLRDGGCWQKFESGSIYSKGGYAHFVSDAVRLGWAPEMQNGPAGYPLGDTQCGLDRGGCYQVFEGGTIYSAPNRGAGFISTDFLPAYGAQNAEWGPLRYPVGPRRCGLGAGGCYQVFEGGSIFSSPATGTFSIRSEVIQVWGPTGAEWGPLGYPTGNPSGTGSSYTQEFQGGTVTVTDGTAVF